MTTRIISFILCFVLQILAVKHSVEQIQAIRSASHISPGLIHPGLVNKFYEQTGNKLKWFAKGSQSQFLRKELKNRIDNCSRIGLQKSKYHSLDIDQNVDKNFPEQDSLVTLQIDRIFTDAAIALCKDIYQGADIVKWVMYDEISKKYEEEDNSYLLQRLYTIKSADELAGFLNTLEPQSNIYFKIKYKLQYNADSLTPFQKKQLSTSLNFYRWVHHFKLEKCIVVNIPSATLRYYENDSLKLQMKLVVGKPSTKTPRFAAYSRQVILYPYWNVPTSIAVNELLPKIKRNPGYIDALNMQLIDGTGNVINHYKLNWSIYGKGNFPFRLRQSTGCDNSLGVIKFDLTSPFGVYLHDTNNKNAFLSSNRFLSHGCIRLEKPIDLANNLLFNKVDNDFLKACLKDQVPISINTLKPVPVFVIYQTVDVDMKNELKFYKDIYGLLR